MKFDLHPKGKPFNMQLGIRVMGRCKLRVTVYDSYTGRVYASRPVKLERNGRITIKLPIVPDELTAEIKNLDTGSPRFVVEHIEAAPDTQCPLELTEGDRQFISFIRWFSTQLEDLEAGEKGTLYQSEGFSILYLDTIREGSIELTTPARVARASGVIEVSAKAIEKYTVPMVIVMLLHEYAHKYKNPEFGKEVENEITADIIAVNIALNLGFDPWEVEHCFRAVFAKVDTDLNRRRMAAISDFIGLFLKTEKRRCKTH